MKDSMDLAYAHQLLTDWGYLIILGWTFLEGETIVILAGFLAATHGLLNPWFIAMSAFGGSFCSDQLMFSLGKYKGAYILKRFPRLDKNSAKARSLLVKYETPLILGFRFVYGVRNVTPILLGISGVSHIKFFALNMIGACVWALSFSFGGYYFGGLFHRFTQNLQNAELWLIGILAAIALVVYLIRRQRNKNTVKHALNVAGITKPQAQADTSGANPGSAEKPKT